MININTVADGINKISDKAKEYHVGEFEAEVAEVLNPEWALVIEAIKQLSGYIAAYYDGKVYVK